MNVVQPIRDRKKIEEVEQFLLAQSPRNYVLFKTGICTGLRVSDILPLRVRNVRGDYIRLREKKTRKAIRRLIIPELRKVLDYYIEGRARDWFLFQSRKGNNRPIGRSRAYEILNTAAKACGLQEIGTHTMRKTFGYHMYRKTKDIGLVKNLLNHSNPAVTSRYIGIDQDEQDRAMRRLWK